MRLNPIQNVGAGAAAGLLLGCAGAAHAVPGAITNLGTLGVSSYGHALNDAGQIAGYYWLEDVGNSPVSAFRYDPAPGGGGTMHDLGWLANGSASTGNGINAAGHVVGTSTTFGPAIQRAFLYVGTPGGGGVMHDLGTLGGDHSGAHAINNSGQIVGDSGAADGSGYAFLYAGGMMHSLGTLDGYRSSTARDINDAGQIAGYARHTSGVWHAFRYDGSPARGGVMHDLGTLGGASSAAGGINSAGQVVGWSDTVANENRAFRYDGTPGAGGVMRPLGELPGQTSSSAGGINDAGAAVGSARFGDVGVPVLWRVDLSAVNLDEWLDQVNPTAGAFWTIRTAVDINNQGVVTGYGRYDDGPGGLSDGLRAYVLDASSIVPEPSGACALFVLGTIPLRRCRGAQ